MNEQKRKELEMVCQETGLVLCSARTTVEEKAEARRVRTRAQFELAKLEG